MAPVVALVTDALSPFHVGGKETRYAHVVSGLVARGVEVHVFTMRWWDGPRVQVIGGATYHAVCRRYALYHRGRRSLVEAVMFALGSLRLLWHRFDLIEADHMPHLQLFPIRLVSRVRRVPLVVTWHEVWGSAAWTSYLGRRAGRVGAALERWTMQLGDALVAASPGTADRLVEGGVPRPRITVVPNGVDLEVIDRAPVGHPPIDVLFVGRLIAHKHVDTLLDALALLGRDGCLRRCTIVGTGPQRAALEAQAARLGLSSVRFVGTLPTEAAVYSLMKAATVLALPSTREGYGIVVAEAIACGCRIVTCDHPDNQARALVEPGRTGLLAAPNAAALAEALEAARQLRPATPSTQPAPSWAATVDQLAHLFGTLLAGAGGGR